MKERSVYSVPVVDESRWERFRLKAHAMGYNKSYLMGMPHREKPVAVFGAPEPHGLGLWPVIKRTKGTTMYGTKYVSDMLFIFIKNDGRKR